MTGGAGCGNNKRRQRKKQKAAKEGEGARSSDFEVEVGRDSDRIRDTRKKGQRFGTKRDRGFFNSKARLCLGKISCAKKFSPAQHASCDAPRRA